MTSLGSIVIAGRQWIVPALALLALLAVVLFWSWRPSEAGRGWRWGCGLLKFAGLAVLLMALLEPLWNRPRARPGANVFGIVADNSQSMTVREQGAAGTRGEWIKKTLLESGGWQAALESDFQVRRYLFDTRLRNTRDFGELTSDGRTSALGHALVSAADQWRGQPAAGLLLSTDGVATDLGLDHVLPENLPPVYPVLDRRAASVRDIAVARVGVSLTAFEDAPVTLQGNVGASGFGGSRVTARLTEVAVQLTSSNGIPEPEFVFRSNQVAEATQPVRGENAELNFRFQWQPAEPGIHIYEFEAADAEGQQTPEKTPAEATHVNNRRTLVVDRGQEMFRILYVGGRPNWEYKFLNRAIQEDRQVRLVSLIRVAPRERKFEFKGRAGESSNPLFRGFETGDEERARYDQPVLIRLNTRDELELRDGFPKTAEELFAYHAIILDDVEAEFFTRDQMSLIERFVSERGGGLLMLGGAESFTEGHYGGTPLAGLLPVYVDQPADLALPGQWKLTLSREGWLQPWMRLRPTEAEERHRLETMPAFEVFNAARGVKPGASVMATVTDPEDRRHPALVVQRFGAGRSAAMLVGDLWRWGLRDEAAQKDLGKTWRQLARWLVADVPGRVTLTAESPGGEEGVKTRLRVRVRAADFKPVDNAIVTLTVRPVRPPGTVANAVELPAEPSDHEPGVYEAVYVAREPGAYVARAVVIAADGTDGGNAVTAWASDPDTEEFKSVQANRALLERIAERTGGEVIQPDDLERFVRTLPQRRAPVMESVSEPLWHRPEVLIFVMGCLVAEWGLRRWKGLA